MDAGMLALRDASYARLERARTEATTLVRTRDPRRARASLTLILALGKRTLDEAAAVADPYLLSHVRMQMAAALFDLAVLETRPERRAKLIAAGTHGCRSAVRAALTSGAPGLSMKVLPWAMVVTAGGLRSAQDGQRAPLQRLMASCAKALPAIEALRRREAREAARELFRAQLMATAAERVTDAAQHGAVIRRAAEVARRARRRALGAGNGAVGKQAERTVRELEAAKPPRPAAAAPAAKFCPDCGTPTRAGRAFCASCGRKLA